MKDESFDLTIHDEEAYDMKDNITVGESALKVVVPKKLEKLPQGYYLVPYPNNLIVGDDIEGSAYNNVVDKTLSTPLPPVEDCVEIDVDEIRIALIKRMDLFMEWGKRSYKNTNDLKHENTSDIINDLAKAIANSKSILKWRSV